MARRRQQRWGALSGMKSDHPKYVGNDTQRSQTLEQGSAKGHPNCHDSCGPFLRTHCSELFFYSIIFITKESTWPDQSFSWPLS